MLTQTNENEHILVIDDDTYKFLLDLGNKELGDDYSAFVNKILSTKIIKRKFILLQGIERKISRLHTMEGTLDLLCDHIKANINKLTPEQSIQFYQTLSSVYDNDVKQLRRLLLEFINAVTKNSNTGM
jgi:hypothetical protein